MVSHTNQYRNQSSHNGSQALCVLVPDLISTCAHCSLFLSYAGFLFHKGARKALPLGLCTCFAPCLLPSLFQVFACISLLTDVFSDNLIEKCHPTLHTPHSTLSISILFYISPQHLPPLVILYALLVCCIFPYKM